MGGWRLGGKRKAKTLELSEIGWCRYERMFGDGRGFRFVGTHLSKRVKYEMVWRMGVLRIAPKTWRVVSEPIASIIYARGCRVLDPNASIIYRGGCSGWGRGGDEATQA